MTSRMMNLSVLIFRLLLAYAPGPPRHIDANLDIVRRTAFTSTVTNTVVRYVSFIISFFSSGIDGDFRIIIACVPSDFRLGCIQHNHGFVNITILIAIALIPAAVAVITTGGPIHG